ncbi:MAG: hypothetical protein ACYC1Y_00960 [Minisyncoccota bacterium]
MNENLHTFVNPKSYWQHQGPFSVELTDDADKSIAPATVKFEGNVAHVEDGYIKQTVGRIQLYASEKPFYWGYAFIKVIRDGNRKPIWVNYHYR